MTEQPLVLPDGDWTLMPSPRVPPALRSSLGRLSSVWPRLPSAPLIAWPRSRTATGCRSPTSTRLRPLAETRSAAATLIHSAAFSSAGAFSPFKTPFSPASLVAVPMWVASATRNAPIWLAPNRSR